MVEVGDILLDVCVVFGNAEQAVHELGLDERVSG